MPRVNPTTTEQLWKSYQELRSLRAVADRHKFVSVGPVWRRLHDAGYPMEPRGRVRSAKILPIEQLIALVEQLDGYKAAAYRVGSTPDAVRMRCRRAGYRRPE